MTEPPMPRRVVMTGATGFLGSHVAALLLARGAEVIALVRGTSSRRLDPQVSCHVAPLDDVPALVEGCSGADWLIHLAGAVDFSDDWELCRRVNVEGTANVLRAARLAGVSRVVHVSSIVAVGASTRPELLDESAPWRLGRLRIPYVTTKREAEHLAFSAVRSGLDVVVVSPGCVVGPDDPSGSEYGTLCKRFWRGRIPFHFAGGGSFVDVRDVAAGIVQAGRLGRSGQRYLLTGHNLTLGDFFMELARVGGRRPTLRLPVAVGRLGAWLGSRLSRPGSRPYLSPAQARLLGLYFWFDCRRARGNWGTRSGRSGRR
jgi:dihydroflavonol-4-reductase